MTEEMCICMHAHICKTKEACSPRKFLEIRCSASHGVYKNWCPDALEGSFTLNLVILVGTTMYINITNRRNQVGATYYVKLSEESQLAVGYASASIAFVTYIGILPHLPATEAHQAVEEGA